MAAAIGNLKSFLGDLLSDLKSSRRFQVATVLWIPLVVTGLISFIRFSIRNELHEKYHEWGTTFIQQSSIQYPDIRVSYANPSFTSVVCATVQPPVVPISSQPCVWPLGTPESKYPCQELQLHQVYAINKPTSWGTLFGNPINCTFTFGANPGQNEEIYIYTPGGWGGQLWSFPPTFVRPNQQVFIHLENQLFFPMDKSPINIWSTQVLYESSIFPQGNSSYQFSVGFRIPFGAQQISWEMVGFDSWFLMAAWGGSFFFFYVLFLAVFNILKFILPNDSKLLRAKADAEYTPLK